MPRNFINFLAVLAVLGILYLLNKVYSSYLTMEKKEYNLSPKLPFLPKTTNFTCDDLFTGTSVDNFNFTEKYYQDLPNFLEEIKRLSGGKFNGEGHTAMFPTQHKTLQYLATRDFMKSICETGFNYGHSSFTFATAKKDNKILTFDIAQYPYTRPMMGYLNKSYPGKFHIVIGDSSITLPKFVAENPTYKCNMIFIDGGHTYTIGYSDLKTLSKIADRDNILVYDDFPTLHGGLITELGKAWEQAKAEKIIIELMRCTRKTDRIRGFSIGQYI